MWLAGSVLVAVVLFFVYLRLSRTYAATSDGADQALQGWDMLHGNWLLRGWTLGDVTYYTTEIPEYALVELFRGLRADDVHIAGAATYTLLVLAAGLLARGRSTGREGLIRFAVAAGIMIAPQFGNNTHLVLSQPDHLGTALPAAAGVLDAGPRAAALVRPGRGRRGAHLGGDRGPGGPAHRGRAARRRVRCPRPARACSGTASRWPPSGTNCP